MTRRSQDENPYRSPEQESDYAARYAWNSEIDLSIVARFRSQVQALAAVWIVAGVLISLTCGLLFATGLRKISTTEYAMGMMFGLPFVALGAAVLARQMWAMRIGLVLTYAAAILSLLSCNILGMALFGLLLVQGHRALAMGGQLTQAGIPLHLRPEDFEA